MPAIGLGLLNQVDAADHLVLMAYGAWDLPLVERLRQLRPKAKTLSVWMPEVWPSELDDRINYESYGMVDHVFVGISEVVDDFRSIASNADVACVPPATDVMTFCPSSVDRERSIAVLGVGRRDAEQHQQLLEWSEQTGRLYLYDTVAGQAPSWAEHRRNLAGWYRQARVAICNYGKHDRPEETGELRIVPGRLFEGMAAGAILVGKPPSEANQREIVGDIVVNSCEHGELGALLDIYAESGAGREQRVRNMALACRRHDWGHRWRDIFTAIGEPVAEDLQRRIDELDRRADLVAGGSLG